jgi:asparagine synthase (glutamine-hydrolysing)
MLDEELFSFALTLPHNLKVKGHGCKRVLREIAARQLPLAVAKKPKRGFAVPVDRWVNAEFKHRIEQSLLGSSSQLPEFFKPESYRPLVEAFSNGRPYQALPREALFRRVVMLLSLNLTLASPAETI